ncbi:MAG TPA: biopolymer transporter ExbD [Chitinophagaceae bacterium]
MQISDAGSSTTSHRPGVKRMQKHSLKIDMTPMVDLGFLLVSFFIFTSELSRPAVTDLYMPKQGKPMPVGESTTITMLLAKDNVIYYYEGSWDETNIQRTTFSVSSGIGNVIRKKQQELDSHPVSAEGRTALMLIIKPSADATYKNVIDALDEALINNVKKYAIVKCDEGETRYLTDSTLSRKDAK